MSLNSTVNATATLNAIPGFDGTWDQALQITWASEFAGVASAALLSYDVFITLEQEIRLVWFGRWGLPSILYMVNRYGTMLQACLNLITDIDYGLSLPACLSWNLFYNWSIPLFIAVIEATLTLRVIALWENNRKFVVCLWIWYIINVAVMLVMMGLTNATDYPGPSPDPPIIGCTITGTENYFWVVYLPSLVYETTIASLTLYKAIQHKRLLRSVPLLYVLIRDGFFYFFIVFALMLLNMLVDLLANFLYFDWAPQLSVSIASAVSVRLFLNLRDVARSSAPETAMSFSGPIELDPMSNITSTPWTTQRSEPSTAGSKSGEGGYTYEEGTAF